LEVQADAESDDKFGLGKTPQNGLPKFLYEARPKTLEPKIWNFWNDFQAANKGKGWSPEKVGREYYKQKKLLTSPSTPALTNPLTLPSAKKPTKKPKNPWNAFQAANKGKGWSPEKVGREYKKAQAQAQQKDSSSKSSGSFGTIVLVGGVAIPVVVAVGGAVLGVAAVGYGVYWLFSAKKDKDAEEDGEDEKDARNLKARL
jgi:hypothetical protein